MIETKSSVYVINPIARNTLERITDGNRNGTTAGIAHYPLHVIVRKNDMHNYRCPHTTAQPHWDLFSVHNILNSTLHHSLQKRSIDVVASNLNFLDADNMPSTNSPPKSTNTSNSSGDKRISFNITVETAVFVDQSLYQVLSKTFPVDTEQQIVLYVLTIMNAVQLLFKQPSIGRSVEISVVLMDLLKQQPKVSGQI